MLTVALTGGIGCGKSTVCQLFSALNVPVIDTDVIAHNLVKPGQPALKEITDSFGKDILMSDSTLNRKALANKVFNDAQQRALLETILHPKIKRVVEQQLLALQDSAYAIIAIPLLIETNQQSLYDHVLVIDCDEELQRFRTQQRDNRSVEEVNAIIETQVSRDIRLDYADEVIDNSHDLDSLKNQVTQYHQQYQQLASIKNHQA